MLILFLCDKEINQSRTQNVDGLISKVNEQYKSSSPLKANCKGGCDNNEDWRFSGFLSKNEFEARSSDAFLVTSLSLSSKRDSFLDDDDPILAMRILSNILRTPQNFLPTYYLSKRRTGNNLYTCKLTVTTQVDRRYVRYIGSK